MSYELQNNSLLIVPIVPVGVFLNVDILIIETYPAATSNTLHSKTRCG